MSTPAASVSPTAHQQESLPPLAESLQDADYPPPLIILGSPRSFTSLICGMIGQHPEAYGVPELNLFMAANVRDMVEELTGYRQIQMHGLLRVVAQIYAGEQSLISVDMGRRWMLTRLERGTDEIYHQLARRIAPLVIVDKSPVYSLKPEYLTRMKQALPNARYLHLLRHPRTQGESIMKVAKGLMAILANSIDYSTEEPTIDPQIAWFDMQQNIENALADIPEERKLRLHGEDVLNSRHKQLGLICEWLGLSTSRKAVTAMMHPELSPYASLGPLGAHLGNDINFLRSPALRSGKIKASTLEGPLPWREDGKGFREEVMALAQSYGYK